MSFSTFITDPHIMIRTKLSHFLAVIILISGWTLFLISLWRYFILTLCGFLSFVFFVYRQWARNFIGRPSHMEYRYPKPIAKVPPGPSESFEPSMHSVYEEKTLRGTLRDRPAFLGDLLNTPEDMFVKTPEAPCISIHLDRSREGSLDSFDHHPSSTESSLSEILSITPRLPSKKSRSLRYLKNRRNQPRSPADILMHQVVFPNEEDSDSE